MMIKNYKKLAVTKQRKYVLDLAEKGIESVLPERFMHDSVRASKNYLYVQNKRFNLTGKRIFVIGGGKAAAAMAVELEKIMGLKRITAGIIISNDKMSKPKKIKVHLADHPIPSERGVKGVKKIFNLKDKYKINENDLIIVLLSGGGSSLLTLPIKEVTLKEKIETIECLIRSGANAHEITTVKKKISLVKGGKMAQYFSPAPMIDLILSDVVDDDQSIIASGPFTRDKTTFLDAWNIIKKYNIKKELPPSVVRHIKSNIRKDISLNLKHVNYFILAGNKIVIEKMKDLAKKRNLKVKIKTKIQGEAKKVACDICRQVFKKNIKSPILYLYGGETTVTLPKKHGKGGRNQEFILSCLNYLEKFPINYNWCIASIGTDGIDYIKESAGGIINNDTLNLIKKNNINTGEFLKRHASYDILKKINSNIYIGHPTGTNVCDVMLFLIEPKE